MRDPQVWFISSKLLSYAPKVNVAPQVIATQKNGRRVANPAVPRREISVHSKFLNSKLFAPQVTHLLGFLFGLLALPLLILSVYKAGFTTAGNIFGTIAYPLSLAS